MHPSIYCYEPFKYENRAIAYWMTVLSELSDPGSYLKAIRPSDVSVAGWWLHDATFIQGMVEPRIAAALGIDCVESAVSFCQEQIERLYFRIAPVSLKGLSYLLEKVPPGGIPDVVREIYPKSAEILLVRDFRDIVCSVLAYNKQRGVASFNRELVTSDDDYVRKMQGAGLAMLRHWQRRESEIILVRYEDLMLEPASTLKSMFGSLGLDNGDDVIGSILESVDSSRPGMRDHRTTSDDRSSVGRWRQDLTEEQKSIAYESLGVALEGFGYDPRVA